VLEKPKGLKKLQSYLKTLAVKQTITDLQPKVKLEALAGEDPRSLDELLQENNAL
jgi:hypothetical protein